MSLPKIALGLSIIGSSFLMISCLGTEAKKLGSKTAASTSTPEKDVDSFAVTLAYRSDSPDDGRVVVLQGIRDIPSAALANNCGTSGATCQCLFYTAANNTTYQTGTISANGVSTASNSFSCSIPNSVDPDDYTRVRLKTSDGVKSTGFIPISTALTIGDVIGDLNKKNVRGVYRYSCIRTFFEGEGVSASAVDCPSAQKLGLITAPYTYYLYNSQNGGNLQKKGSNVAWESAICEKQFSKLTCDGVPEVRWGLYGEQTGIFQVPIVMVANAVDADARQTYGYAALTDTKGNCPTGLVKISQWEAQPQSIVQGSIDGTNPPSSFVNQTNNLNNKMVEETLPSPFLVSRQKNLTPCAVGTGSCAAVTFNGVSQVQSVTYTQLTPVVCAIPRDLIIGLF